MAVITGDSSVIDALLFGAPAPSTQGFIRNELNRFTSAAVGEFGAMMVGKMKSLYETFHSSSAMNMMQAALNQARSLVMPDTIYRFTRIEDFQIAQHQMQRYVMANPVIRQMYHNQQCDGYSDSYVDKHPGKIGKNHVDYQIVTNGMLEDDELGDMSYTNYSGAYDQKNGCEVLNAPQQHAVMASWRALEKIVEQGEYDPVSPWNTKL